MTQSLTGEVVSVVFHNPESQYLVARVRAPEEPGQVTIVGNIGHVVPGERLELLGEWKEHPKFGRQFQVTSCTQSLPASENGIRRYLSSGLIKGIGPSLAERLIERFGRSVLDVLDEAPERLLEVEGIGQKKLEQIKESWAQQQEVRHLLLFLQSHDVPPTFAGRIFKRYGAQAIEKLQQNPYDLAYDIRGIGFKTADNMALKLGFAPDSPQRLQAALLYVLTQQSEQGHLFMPREELLAQTGPVLDGLDPDKLERALGQLEERKRVRIMPLPELEVDAAVFLRHMYHLESEIASRLVAMLSHPGQLEEAKVQHLLGEAERQVGLAISTEQREAVLEACQNKISILTGGPGTGKTTITKLIVVVLRRLGLKVKLAAPTGRASKRLAEATDSQAHTLHRLLGFGPEGEFAFTEERKLKLDVLIVDEVSMLDCRLFSHLLRALPLTCRLIMIGDVNQLPSVGPGNVLADLLASGVLPSRELQQIYRQAQESQIVMNAHRIKEGLFPLSSDKRPPEADFFWVEQDDPLKVQELIVHTVCERIPKIYGLDPILQVQVLSPMHKGAVGTIELNRLLQERLNPPKRSSEAGSRSMRPGDRVLQVRNNYEKEVFNGDLGWVRHVDSQTGGMHIEVDGRELVYEAQELDELVLAYAISIHKSQGSEYPAVVIPLVTQHYVLLQRNLIYTGLTRARRLAVLLGSQKAMRIGINNQRGEQRNTYLRHQLRQAAAGA